MAKKIVKKATKKTAAGPPKKASMPSPGKKSVKKTVTKKVAKKSAKSVAAKASPARLPTKGVPSATAPKGATRPIKKAVKKVAHKVAPAKPVYGHGFNRIWGAKELGYEIKSEAQVIADVRKAHAERVITDIVAIQGGYEFTTVTGAKLFQTKLEFIPEDRLVINGAIYQDMRTNENRSKFRNLQYASGRG